jgi:hypothetical protein
MFLACWSAKGGSGTTVVAAALALLAARSVPTGVLFVDFMGDGPAVLGFPSPQVSVWLSGWRPGPTLGARPSPVLSFLLIAAFTCWRRG